MPGDNLLSVMNRVRALKRWHPDDHPAVIAAVAELQRIKSIQHAERVVSSAAEALVALDADDRSRLLDGLKSA